MKPSARITQIRSALVSEIGASRFWEAAEWKAMVQNPALDIAAILRYLDEVSLRETEQAAEKEGE